VIHGGHSTARNCDAGLALYHTRKLDNIEGIVPMHIHVLLEPAASAEGKFAFAASIGEGNTLGAYGTNFIFAIDFESVDDTPDCDYGLLVTRLMLEPTRDTIWQSTVGALSKQCARLDS
jgi:hypothetical protein